MRDLIKKLIKKRGKYALLRFGLGQLSIMEGVSHGLHDTDDVFASDLKKAFQFTDDNYYKCSCLYKMTDEFLKLNLNYLGKHSWYEKYREERKNNYPSIIFMYLSLVEPRLLNSFLKTLKGGTFVGGKHLESVANDFNADFVEVPERNAYYDLNNYYSKIKKSPVILSCGAASSVIQYKLWNDTDFTTVDIGSVSDVFVSNNRWRWQIKNKNKMNKINELKGLK